MSALDFLRKDEWSMGNGQCPDCHGVPEKWFGHPLFLTADLIGHHPDRKMALAIQELGGEALIIGDFKSDVECETCTTNEGFLSTRIKDAHHA